MMDPAVMRAMLAAGCSAEQIVAVAEAAALANDEKKAAKRANNADRQRRFRERNAPSRVTRVTNTDDALQVSPKKETSPTPPKEKTTPSTFSEATASSNEVRATFDEFWSLFPNKVGKRDAEREFALALKRSSFDAIMAGLQRYVAKTDDRPWCNPSTFLHQNRWDDQPAAAPRGNGPSGNRKPNVVDAMQQIFEERGWTNGPNIVRGNIIDDHGVPAERSEHQGAVVDLRAGAYRRG